jgi:hypothetical protein
MAKRAAPELLPEAKREKDRQWNAEKQKRFRDKMKAGGRKALRCNRLIFKKLFSNRYRITLPVTAA